MFDDYTDDDSKGNQGLSNGYEKRSLMQEVINW